MNVDKDRKIIRASINYPIKLIFSKYYVLLIVEKEDRKKLSGNYIFTYDEYQQKINLYVIKLLKKMDKNKEEKINDVNESNNKLG